MNKPHTKVKVLRLPKCAICGQDAKYDAASFDGRWGFFCQAHWEEYTPMKLGLGLGQELVQAQPEDVK
jgi:hypothetical protein